MVVPGCAKYFCCCAPLGAATFRRGQSKNTKNTTQGVFFLGSGPGERQRKEKPRWAPAQGQSKKTTPRVRFFFALAPCRRPTGLLLPLPFAGARAKKQHTLMFFFALAPFRRPTGLLLPLPFAGAGAKKKTPWVVVFVFLLWPRRKVAAPSGAQQKTKKKTLCTPGDDSTKILEATDTGHEQKGVTTKKNTLAGLGIGGFRGSETLGLGASGLGV